ncbi:MAG TPA: hypothetical protein VFM18_08425, partial [Methanosarcina sp.]|nr:hypothetical protein [Methanosarcina sp.]
MAYMSQEKKAQLAPAIKAVLKKYNMKGSIAVRHHSTLVVNIKSGSIDFGFNDRQVNVHWIDSHYEGIAKEFLLELKSAMMTGNHDRSDLMTDWFDVGWYVDINIGAWN